MLPCVHVRRHAAPMFSGRQKNSHRVKDCGGESPILWLNWLPMFGYPGPRGFFLLFSAEMREPRSGDWYNDIRSPLRGSLISSGEKSRKTSGTRVMFGWKGPHKGREGGYVLKGCATIIRRGISINNELHLEKIRPVPPPSNWGNRPHCPSLYAPVTIKNR